MSLLLACSILKQQVKLWAINRRDVTKSQIPLEIADPRADPFNRMHEARSIQLCVLRFSETETFQTPYNVNFTIDKEIIFMNKQIRELHINMRNQICI